MSDRFTIKMPGKLLIVLVVLIPLAIVLSGRYYLTRPEPNYTLPPDLTAEVDGAPAGDASGAGGNEQLTGEEDPPESPALLRDLQDLEKRFTNAVGEGRSLLVIRQAAADLVAAHPDSPAAHRLLGLVHAEDGRLEDGYRHLARSLELYPKQPEAQLTSGTVAVKLGRLDLARRHYEKALQLRPQQNRYLLHMAQLELHEKNVARAREIAEDMLARDSRAHRGHALLSSIAIEEGNVDAALSHLQTAIENTPLSEQDVQLQYQQQKVKLLREAGRLDDAMQVLRSLLFMHGEDPYVIEQAALTWAQLDETAAAAELYEEALAKRPEDLRLVIGAAKWSIAAGRLREADRHILTLRQLHPHAPALATLQEALRQARSAQPQS